MSYTKHAWVTGETITAEKLNNIEDGIDGIDGGKQNAPVTAGTAGQVLALDDNLNPVWANQSGGGGGGTSDYSDLTNKPSINGHILTGDQSASNLGLATPSDIPTVLVQSVNGKTGEVALNSGDIEYDGTATYQSGTVGAELQNQTRQLSDKQDKPATAGTAGQVLALDDNLNPVWANQSGGGGGGGMNIVNLSGTQITQVGADNTMYMCGELTELTFTAPAVGITGIRFTSGTTPTVLTINGVTAWMFDFDPTSLEASTTYEINVLNGVGVVGWA